MIEREMRRHIRFHCRLGTQPGRYQGGIGGIVFQNRRAQPVGGCRAGKQAGTEIQPPPRVQIVTGEHPGETPSITDHHRAPDRSGLQRHAGRGENEVVVRQFVLQPVADPAGGRAKLVQGDSSLNTDGANQCLLVEGFGQQQAPCRFGRQRGTGMEAGHVHGVQNHREPFRRHATRQATIPAKIIHRHPMADLRMRPGRLHLKLRAVAGKDRRHIGESRHGHQGGRGMLQMQHIGLCRQRGEPIHHDMAARPHPGCLRSEQGGIEHRMMTAASQPVGEQFHHRLGPRASRNEKIAYQHPQAHRLLSVCQRPTRAC